MKCNIVKGLKEIDSEQRTWNGTLTSPTDYFICTVLCTVAFRVL